VATTGSSIEGLGADSAFARYVAGRLNRECFKLIDVGCAGGIAQGWRAFGDRLAAVCFEADASEIARLRAAETNPRITYAAGWVGLPDEHPLRRQIGNKAYWHHWPACRHGWERTRDLRRARIENREPKPLEAYLREDVLGQDWLTTPQHGFDLDYARAFEVFAPAAAIPAGGQPDGVVHLSAHLEAAGFQDADFLKLDIDGPDFEVLRSVGELLSRPSLLGVCLEVSFFGSHDANDNSFHNMDRLMRQKGFDLFGLSVRNYSSAALPWPYLDADPGKNTRGRPGQGDAIYIRDLGSRVRREDAGAVSDEKLAKSAALFALTGLPDFAAELLIAHRERLSGLLDVDQALDLLTREVQPDEPFAASYRDYIARFEAEDSRFFNNGRAQAERMAELLRIAVEEPLARVRAEALARAAEDRLAEVESRLRAIEQSSTWRLSAPLRAAIDGLKGLAPYATFTRAALSGRSLPKARW
jgi:hypothetical protein